MSTENLDFWDKGVPYISMGANGLFDYWLDGSPLLESSETVVTSVPQTIEIGSGPNHTILIRQIAGNQTILIRNSS